MQAVFRRQDTGSWWSEGCGGEGGAEIAPTSLALEAGDSGALPGGEGALGRRMSLIFEILLYFPHLTFWLIRMNCGVKYLFTSLATEDSTELARQLES